LSSTASRLILVAATSFLCLGTARGQCILANPSFEMPGSGGAVFGGWNQFGIVGWTAEATHGSRAARATGLNLGGWEVSALWQSQDCAPGEQWEAKGTVRHPAGAPLVGSNAALVNVEWRDAADNLIDYDSFTVLTASSPADEVSDFSVLSAPAPAGTVTARILVGVLQSPSDPSSDVIFDEVSFYSTTPPTIEDVQWNDFPSGNTVNFAGWSWRVKGPGLYGPGSNLFCPDSDCVWVDGGGSLHMTLAKEFGQWYSTEVVLEEALGYGDYVLTTVGRLDLIDPQAVLGIFLWEYGLCWDPAYMWWNPYNEIDIEYSRWGNIASEIGQFVAQPWDYPNNRNRFDYVFGTSEVVSHAMRWLPDRVEYRVWSGGPDDESPQNTIYSWTYTGPHIPRPEAPRMHLNLWKLDGTPASDQEVIFTDFRFRAEGPGTPVEDGGEIPSPGGRLFAAVPNPFNPQTSIRFELRGAGHVSLTVYDTQGRRVRNLADGNFGVGTHELPWNGVDDAGSRVASGVYFVQLLGEGFVETQRVALVK